MNNIIDFHIDTKFQDIIYKEPTKESIKFMKNFLKDNKNEIVRLYHGTSAKHKILKEGLKPTSSKTKKSLQSQSGYVYLNIYPTMAKTFSEMAYPKEKIIVYNIDIPIYKLKADINQLNNKRYWGRNYKIGNTLAESILYGSGARVKGKVEPYIISIYNENIKKL